MVARTIWSRRSGPIPSFGVSFALPLLVIIDWSTNYPDEAVCRGRTGGSSETTGRGTTASLLVPGALEIVLELVHQHVRVGGRDDQAIGGHVAAVDASLRRRVRAPQATDQLHLA